MGRGVLEGHEDPILSEALCEVLRALSSHVVAAQTANEAAHRTSVTLQVSGAADTFVSVTRAGCGDEGEEEAEVRGILQVA